jgi:hypothetical protein
MITVSKHTVTTNILSINTWKYPNISTQTGKIDVESEVENGTTFILSIPNENNTTQRAVSSESSHEIKAKGLRILVVDDNEDMRSVLNQ